MTEKDLRFDIEKAIKYTNDYIKATGINASILDESGNTVYCNDTENKRCRFCHSLQRLLQDSEICKKTHLYGLYQAERFGGKYIFFCPLSLMHWISPIVSNDNISGAILGGPIIPVDDENFFEDEVASKKELSVEDMETLRNAFKDIPYVDPARVTSLSELLYLCANQVSGADAGFFTDDTMQLEQSSRISEYIQYIKSLESNKEGMGYPLEKEQELLEKIKMADKAGAQELLNEILGHVFFATGRRLDLIKSRVLELVVLLSRASMTGGADAEQVFGLNYRYLNQINKINNVDGLAYWLSKIMQRFTDCVFILKEAKHADMLRKSIAYMRKNYMHKITLEEVAEHVYLSPSYFSRIFKKEINDSFISYLNQIRIEKSKRLLTDTNIPLIDIAHIVGFEDQSYFTKVFKRKTGRSPGKFRESGGALFGGDELITA